MSQQKLTAFSFSSVFLVRVRALISDLCLKTNYSLVYLMFTSCLMGNQQLSVVNCSLCCETCFRATWFETLKVFHAAENRKLSSDAVTHGAETGLNQS